MKTKFNDVRDITLQSRSDIGFHSNFKLWEDEPAILTEEALVIHGHPVMEAWEREYMYELAAIATQNGGKVLEVGFGMGISAEFIQSHPIDEHIIIEANHDVFNTLERFSEQSIRPTTPLRGFWQDVTKTLEDGSIAGILFDTYPLTENEVHKNHFEFFAEAYRLLQPGGILTYYSDEINDFSPEHLKQLNDAGFQNIQKKICEVSPPKDCQYWKSNTILAPIITK